MFKKIIGGFFVLACGFMALPANAVTAPTLSPQKSSETIVNRVKVDRGYIRIMGTADAGDKIIIKVNGKLRLRNKTFTAGEKGHFEFYYQLRNKKKNKKLRVNVYAKDAETNQLSAPARLLFNVPKKHSTRTYSAAGVKDYCEVEGNSYAPVRAATITAYTATEEGRIIGKFDETTTDSRGEYSLELPRNSNVLIQAYKENYARKTDSMLVDLRLNSKNGNINQYLYLCSSQR